VGVGAILTLLLFAAEAPELTDAQLAERAETAFQEGRGLRDNGDSGKTEFQTAAALYEQMRQRGVANPALVRNLGHAYVLADDLPNAILTLRRGVRLWPYDGDLQRNLVEARALVAYPPDNPLGRPPVEKRLPWPPYAVTILLFAAVVFYCGMCVSITRWLMTRRGWLLIVAAICLLAASLPTSLLTSLLLDADRRHHADTERTLVVIKDDGVLLRKGDSLKYPSRYDTPLNRGVEARLVHERDDWVQIELVGGEIGWVPRHFVLIDRSGVVALE
jgi:hypothetical protein